MESARRRRLPLRGKNPVVKQRANVDVEDRVTAAERMTGADLKRLLEDARGETPRGGFGNSRAARTSPQAIASPRVVTASSANASRRCWAEVKVASCQPL
jgi:hypothetical protein